VNQDDFVVGAAVEQTENLGRREVNQTKLEPPAPRSTPHPSGLDLHYQVAMPHPESHLFEVTLQVKGWSLPLLDLKFPVWTPGSYLVREYARHLQDFTAHTETTSDRPLPWRKVSKNHWQIELADLGANPADITVRYQIFANELTVRTNHLDRTHGYFNGAALFFFLPKFERYPITVAIVPPDPSWRITTPLPSLPGQPHTFYAADFDTLVDSPFEIGTHQLHEFEVLGKPHQLAIWGQGNAEPEHIMQDVQKIIEAEAQVFEGLPYDRYLFLLHLTSQGFGGLEHKNACSLIYLRFGFRAKDKYQRFMQLVAHEFFHLWNVKRIRPKALEVFDYEAENYTPSLWFSEGTTSYYDLVIPFRAGIYDAKTFLSNVGKEITRFQTTPGRRMQSASESSFDAWIKLYRPDTNSANSQISYYLKGELISFLLDLLIRSRHGNRRSLDDVMRLMWQRFGRSEVGFTPEALQEAIECVADTNLGDFFHRYVDGVEELPFDQYLQPFGLKIQSDLEDDPAPHLGLTARSENGREMIKFVEAKAPAQQAGIDAGDELLAIDGLRVSADQLGERLKDYQPGDTIELAVFHQEHLCLCPVTLAPPQPTRYQVVGVKRLSPDQEHHLSGWLGMKEFH